MSVMNPAGVAAADEAVSRGYDPRFIRAEDYAEFDRFLWRMHFDAPWYVGALSGFRRELTRSPQIPTAAVGWRAGELVLLVNPDFFFPHPESQRQFIMKHEIQHIMRKHLELCKKYPERGQIMNFIEDALINEEIIHDENLSASDIPPNLVRMADFELQARMHFDENRANGRKVPEWKPVSPEVFIRDFAAEHLLQYLPTNNDFGGIDRINERMGPGEFFDDESVDEAFQEELINAAAAAGQAAGETPASLKIVIEGLRDRTSRKWRDVLRAAGRSAQLDINNSFATLFNKRRPWISRGRKMLMKPKVIFGVDTSGSTQYVMDTFLAELNNGSYELDIDMAFFDAAFDPNDPAALHRDIKRGQAWASTETQGMAGGGGTDFSDFYDWLQQPEQQNRYDALILLTDGYIWNSRYPDDRVLKGLARSLFLLLTPDHDDDFVEEAKQKGYFVAIIDDGWKKSDKRA